MKLKAILAFIHFVIFWCLLTVAWPNAWAWASEAAQAGPAPWMQATDSMPDVNQPSDMSGADQENCTEVILGEVNARLGTSFVREDVAQVQMAGWDHPEAGFVRGGGYNIRIVKTLSADEGSKVHAGRFADWWTFLDLGIRPSLHIPGNFDGQNVLNMNWSSDGQSVTVDFVAHTDDAYAYTPFGFIWHEVEDVIGANTRPPCPIESDVDPELQ